MTRKKDKPFPPLPDGGRPQAFDTPVPPAPPAPPPPPPPEPPKVPE